MPKFSIWESVKQSQIILVNKGCPKELFVCFVKITFLYYIFGVNHLDMRQSIMSVHRYNWFLYTFKNLYVKSRNIFICSTEHLFKAFKELGINNIVANKINYSNRSKWMKYIHLVKSVGSYKYCKKSDQSPFS